MLNYRLFRERYGKRVSYVLPDIQEHPLLIKLGVLRDQPEESLEQQKELLRDAGTHPAQQKDFVET
jgi:hypothetical protein